MSDFKKILDNNKVWVEKQLAIDKDFQRFICWTKSAIAMDQVL
jgi:hypothetical protein